MIKDYLKEMRLKHWYKAGIVFVAPILAGLLFTDKIAAVFFAFLAFGFIASSIYVINDLMDADKDRLHPKKRNRPIASGKISRNSALLFSSILILLALVFANKSSTEVTYLVGSYFFLMIFYTYYLKNKVIVDAFTISLGFVLRALAGGFAVGVEVTPWLYLGIFSFAMYLAFCKRYTEIKLAGTKHKKTLEEYQEIIHILIAISGAITSVLYSIYAIDKGGLLFWSVPFAYLGGLLHLRETFLGKEVHESITNPEVFFTFLIFVLIVLFSVYL
ncbi:MAG: UbiA prenyltransferase family protein [Candidatus Altiarchaeota archaeon]|nr:UbiA prenyltransferase family protein [Candidatus Altiarchaeota archaeon]